MKIRISSLWTKQRHDLSLGVCYSRALSHWIILSFIFFEIDFQWKRKYKRT